MHKSLDRSRLSTFLREEEELYAPTAPFLAIEMQKGNTQLSFFTTLTTLGTSYDITLHELRIESFFPADDPTTMTLQGLSAAGVT